jgi:small subunit ribosomal protein S20
LRLRPAESVLRLTPLEALVIEHGFIRLIFRDAARFPSAKPLSKDHIMANTKSAKKAVRQTSRRTTANKTRRSRMRSSVRKVEEAIASGNKEAARAALKEAEPIIVRTAQKGMVHRKTASRKVSRLAKRVGAMGTP